MASSGVDGRIIEVFRNPEGINNFNINDVYTANLITNHGYHLNAKNMIVPPACVEIEEATYDDTPYIDIRVPFSMLPYNNGDEVNLVGLNTSLSSAGIEPRDIASDELDYTIGDTISFGSNGLLYPTGEWCESRNGHLMLCFEYEKETFVDYFVNATYKQFILSLSSGFHHVLFAFKKASDGKIYFEKAAVVEPVT